MNKATLSNFARTKNWLAACGKQPSDQGMSVQLGCHLEEIAELLSTIGLTSTTGLSSSALQEVASVLEGIGTNLKKGHATAEIFNREAFLDALCDSDVTGNGLAYMAGMDKDEADRRVLFANDDKMSADGTPVILPGGKIGKREGWTAPDLSDLV